MASWGGHTLPGTFFIIFGIFYAFKFTRSYLKRPRTGQRNNGLFYCCKGKIPCSGMVIEGVVKVVFVSIGILVELFYPGAPMGRLHDSASGNFTHPMNWQHATMYFFFGLSGITDIIAFEAKHVVPPGLDRIGGALALFIEGYLFFFHLHGRSHIDTRVHILLVLTVWPSALIAFAECLVMNRRNILHILEMMHTTLLIAQGTWFWQAAYILYPPGAQPWDPCMMHENDTGHVDGHSDSIPEGDCNEAGEMNLMFITLFWSWHIAACFTFVGLIYFLMYKFLKIRGQLDPRFSSGYEHMNGGKITSSTPLNTGLLSNGEEDDEL
uniref:Transmembrane protein 45B n=1 Tax=Phallusia mammillata TaxID=59560 RepID=A0A6F9DUI8_9ASCI|nr:transmembrane protein 45B [Phallusia mammillata]